MLRFQVFSDGKPAPHVELNGAYLVGSDGVPIRAELQFREGEIRCSKRAQGPAALVLLWPVQGYGQVMLQTARVPERPTPYNLHLELARGRLAGVFAKCEEWGLFDYPGVETIWGQIDRARDLMIRALQADEPAEAAQLAEQSLALAVHGGEQLSLFHAEVFLARRKQTGHFPRQVFGCFVDLACQQPEFRRQLLQAFDLLTVPIPWRLIEPREQQLEWEPIDDWMELLHRRHITIKASPLVAFDRQHIPDWLYIWEHDFETVRDLVAEHCRRVLDRYSRFVQIWNVISGIHVENCFHFNFEQLIELTRLAATLTKQLAPRSTAVIDLLAPWGEYYARNQRTIPPLLYAEMCTQSGINFDALGLHFYFGLRQDGLYVRDMLQISSLLDRFGNLGKPIHITACQVPSATAVDQADAWAGQMPIAAGGEWHRPWDEQTQSLWLRDFVSVALSKPFVETVTWRDLSDAHRHYMPHGGLLRKNLSPKPAYHELRALRAEILGDTIIDQQGRIRTRPPSS